MPPLGLVRFSEGAGQHALAHPLVCLVYLLVRFLRADGRQLVVQLFFISTCICCCEYIYIYIYITFFKNLSILNMYLLKLNIPVWWGGKYSVKLSKMFQQIHIQIEV